MKGKPLLPTLKSKKRYIVYGVISEKTLDHSSVFSSITASFRDCFGSFALAKSGLRDMEINKEEKGILRINHKYVEQLRAALAMTTHVKGTGAILHTIGASGILKKAKAKYM